MPYTDTYFYANKHELSPVIGLEAGGTIQHLQDSQSSRWRFATYELRLPPLSQDTEQVAERLVSPAFVTYPDNRFWAG